MIIARLNSERLGFKPPVEEKKVPEKEDSPVSIEEEDVIPVIVEDEPEPPKPESVKEVSEVDDSKDWFNADAIK